MAVPYLASTAVMGLLAVGIVVLIVRGRPWHHYVPQAAYGMEAGGGQPASALSQAVGDVNTWTAAYILLVLGVLGGAIVTLSGAVQGPAVIAVLAAGVLVYLTVGVYVAMRENGRSSAQAAGTSAVALGLLMVVGISVKLVLGL